MCSLYLPREEDMVYFSNSLDEKGTPGTSNQIYLLAINNKLRYSSYFKSHIFSLKLNTKSQSFKYFRISGFLTVLINIHVI